MAPKKKAAARGGGAGGKDVFWLAKNGYRYGDKELEAAFDALVAGGARMSGGGAFDADGRSPLMVAAAHANTRLMRLLLEKARVPVDEISPEDGSTALHCCVSKDVVVEDPAAAALLLDAGANIEARDATGATPLATSVPNQRAAPTRLLLDRGADVNVRLIGGWTPLILATEKPWLRDERWPLFQEIMRRSSTETRRAVGVADRHSAVDFLARLLAHVVVMDAESRRSGEAAEEARVQERCRSAIAELLASGTPVLPQNAERVAYAGGGGVGGARGPLFFGV